MKIAKKYINLGRNMQDFFFNIGKNPKTFKLKIYFLLKIILNAPNYPFGDRYKTQI